MSSTSTIRSGGTARWVGAGDVLVGLGYGALAAYLLHAELSHPGDDSLGIGFVLAQVAAVVAGVAILAGAFCLAAAQRLPRTATAIGVVGLVLTLGPLVLSGLLPLAVTA